MVEALVHRVVPAVDDVLLGRGDADWRLGGNRCGKLDGLLETVLTSWGHVAHEALFEGLVGVEEAASVDQLSEPGVVADYFLEALYGAEVCAHANVNLLDGELGVLRGHADVASAADVDAGSDDIAG